MKKFKNKKTFLLCLLGFYAFVAIFTGVTMYLPYMDTEEYYDEAEDYSEEDEDYSEEEDYSEDEEYSEEEEEYSEDESYSEDEGYSEEEDDYSEENADYEDTSDSENTQEDLDDTEEFEDDNYEDNADDSEDPEEDAQSGEDLEDSYTPYTEDTENNLYDDSVAIPTPIQENTIATTLNGEGSENTGTAKNTASPTSLPTEIQAVSNPLPLAFSYTGKGKLNIRKEPSMSGSIVGTISNNSTGMILEFTNDDWAKVTCNNLEGYVAYQYIEYTLPENALIPSPKPSAIP